MANTMVFCVGNTPEKDRAFLDYATFAGIPVRQLIGSYKGQVETSFAAPVEFAQDILPLIKGEESVLLLDGDIESKPQAKLFYPATLDEEPLGTLEEVTEAEAKSGEAWTYDPASGRYYTTH